MVHRLAIPKTKILDARGNHWVPSARDIQQIAASAPGAFPGQGPWKGASGSRRGSWFAGVGSADTDLLDSLEELRARSRDLERNQPIAGGAIKTLISNVLGPGLRVRPQINQAVLGISRTEKKALEQDFRMLFQEWGNSIECDIQRRRKFGVLQALAFRTGLVSGDVLTTLPAVVRAGSRFETKIQIIEADRISNPNLRMNTPRLIGGVELDGNGAPVAYHVRRSHPGERIVSRTDMLTWQRIPAFGKRTGRLSAWLHYEDQRPEQNRGIPYFSSVLEQLKQAERYVDAELAAAVISGTFTVFVTSDGGQGFSPLASVPFGQPVDTVNTENDIGLDYGAIVDLKPGEKVEFADPKRPNQGFGDFMNSIFQQVGAGLGVPFELLLRHFQSSYSASRAALLEAWKYFMYRRSLFSQGWCQPIYEMVLTEAVLKGFISAPGFLSNPSLKAAYCGALWIGPAPGMIDPSREMKAVATRLENRVSSRAIEVPAITGEDWETVLDQITGEEEDMRSAGLATMSQPVMPPEGLDVDPDAEGQPEA